jgi:hypothetical protein
MAPTPTSIQEDLGLVVEAVEPPASMPEVEFVWPEASERD